MRILVTGGNGFVGRSLTRSFLASGHHVTALSKAAMNIGDEAQVRRALDELEPDVLVNCAGDKNLERCEDDPTRAMQLNAYAPAMLARVCGEAGVKFVHIGSDHGDSEPLTAYGASKAHGHEWVMRANPNALVAVTGHVYAPDCPWLLWLDAELRACREVDAWSSLYNWPTYAPNLAAMLSDLIHRDARGIVGCVGGERVNRRQLFQWYALAAGLDASLVVAGASLPTALHPRVIRLPPLYVGKVRRMTVAEGMQAMCRKGVLEEVAA